MHALLPARNEIAQGHEAPGEEKHSDRKHGQRWESSDVSESASGGHGSAPRQYENGEHAEHGIEEDAEDSQGWQALRLEKEHPHDREQCQRAIKGGVPNDYAFHRSRSCCGRGDGYEVGPELGDGIDARVFGLAVANLDQRGNGDARRFSKRPEPRSVEAREPRMNLGGGGN